MVSRVGGVVSDDFRKQLLGYGLTTAQILYRMPDHPSLLQTYVWQNYDLFPKFPALQDFLSFWQQKLEGPLFAVTVALTQPMSNQAAALVMLPLAIGTAKTLGYDPRPFVIGITVAASNSFITPLEPSCMLVYGPGHYTFMDFVRVGAGLTLLAFAVSMLVIPLVFSALILGVACALGGFVGVGGAALIGALLCAFTLTGLAMQRGRFCLLCLTRDLARDGDLLDAGVGDADRADEPLVLQRLEVLHDLAVDHPAVGPVVLVQVDDVDAEVLLRPQHRGPEVGQRPVAPEVLLGGARDPALRPDEDAVGIPIPRCQRIADDPLVVSHLVPRRRGSGLRRGLGRALRPPRRRRARRPEHWRQRRSRSPRM